MSSPIQSELDEIYDEDRDTNVEEYSTLHTNTNRSTEEEKRLQELEKYFEEKRVN